MAKKRKQSIPRRKRMKREGRLSNAKSTGWVANYSGKNIIRGYVKWYGVDGPKAIRELRSLGVSISEEREAQIRTTVEQNAKKKAEKKAERKALREAEEIDYENEWCGISFSYIAGYTAGGAPYGIESDPTDD